MRRDVDAAAFWAVVAALALVGAAVTNLVGVVFGG